MQKKLNFLNETVASVKETIKQLNRKRNLEDLRDKKKIIAALALQRKYNTIENKHLGISYKMLKRAAKDPDKIFKRKVRNDMMELDNVNMVKVL